MWVGATSDTHYQENSSIFEAQRMFAEGDIVYGNIVPFHNIFDKGYRVNLMTWRQGRQEVEQPIFAHSDKKFSGGEILRSASIIAADCSANERVFKMLKMSDMIRRGLNCDGFPERLDNVCLAWISQCNFMFHKIL